MLGADGVESRWVNLTGTWLTLRAGAQAIVDAGVGGSKVAAVEWGRYGIRVNAVGPG